MLQPEYIAEVEELQEIYRQQIYAAESRCAEKISAVLPASKTYSAHAKWAESWDATRRRNREVDAQFVLNIEIETIDRIFADLMDCLNKKYGLE